MPLESGDITEEERGMDIGKSFKFMFDDENWVKKILIGGVLNIIPIANFIPMGYSLRALKNVSEGQDVPLPEFDDWGGDFVRGLLVLLAALIYALPIFVLQVIMIAVTAVAGQSSDAATIAGICATAVTCLIVLYGLAMALWLPAAYTRYADSGQFGAFFQFGDLWSFIRDNLRDYIIAVLLILVAQMVASLVGSIACGIGVAFTAFWAMLVSASLLGQVLAESKGAGAGVSFGAEGGTIG